MRFSSLLGLMLLGCAAVASAACNEEPPQKLSGDDETSDRFDKPSDEDDRPATRTETTAPPAAAPQQQKPATPPATNACNAKANKTECLKCCGVQQNPLKDCGCTGECADACGDNLCSDKMPTISCGICLATKGQDCNIEFTKEDQNAAMSCAKSCAAMPDDEN